MTGIRARRPGRATRPARADPFAVLGLPPDPRTSDDDVRAAWRRIAAATHPDRDDGGDPERFARAAAAYTDLRTAGQRAEARADLPVTVRRPAALSALAGLRPGRPGRLMLRIVIAVAAAGGAVLAAGPGPAAWGLIAGAATWLILTARNDMRRG